MNMPPSDPRESIRRCDEIYESFSDLEKISFNFLTKQFKKDCRKLDWLCWLEHKIKNDIKQAEVQLRYLVIGSLLALFLIWTLMFFLVFGKNYASYVVLILLYFWLVVDTIQIANFIPTLRFKESEVEVKIILSKKSIIEIDPDNFFIRDQLEHLVEVIQKTGLSNEAEKYMPFVAEGIALLIKNKHRVSPNN
jgi:hypothetical protein